MSGGALNSGLGICTPSHRLVITPTRATAELGAFPDLLQEVFAATHRVNRHSASAGYAAICLPQAGAGRGLQALGEEIALLGKEQLLQAILSDEKLLRLRRRGMFTGQVENHDFKSITAGHVLLRSRQIEDRVVGGQRLNRQARRDARRAAHITATSGQFAANQKPQKPERLTGFVTLKEGPRIDFIARRAEYTGLPIMVSSYGLSRLNTLSVLPWGETG